MSLTDIIPVPYRWLALAGLLLAGVGTGFVLGVEHEADRNAPQLSQIAATGAAQTATARAETARKVENNQENSNGYQSAAAHLVARLEQSMANQPSQPGVGGPAAPAGALVGLRLPAAAGSSSGMPDHAGARSGLDAATAQPGADGAGGTAAEPGDIKALIRNAAADALQVLWLQDYVLRVCLAAQPAPAEVAHHP